jgi:hypothetical protein
MAPCPGGLLRPPLTFATNGSPRIDSLPANSSLDHSRPTTNGGGGRRCAAIEGRVGLRAGGDHRRCRCRSGSLYPPGYPGDHPCPAKGTAIQSHDDEDQGMLQLGTLGVRHERHGQAELH